MKGFLFRSNARDIVCVALTLLVGSALSFALLRHVARREYEPINRKPHFTAKGMVIAKCMLTSLSLGMFVWRPRVGTAILLTGTAGNLVWLIPGYGDGHELRTIVEANYRYQLGLIEFLAAGVALGLQAGWRRQWRSHEAVFLTLVGTFHFAWLLTGPWMAMPDI